MCYRRRNWGPEKGRSLKGVCWELVASLNARARLFLGGVWYLPGSLLPLSQWHFVLHLWRRSPSHPVAAWLPSPILEGLLFSLPEAVAKVNKLFEGNLVFCLFVFNYCWRIFISMAFCEAHWEGKISYHLNSMRTGNLPFSPLFLLLPR